MFSSQLLLPQVVGEVAAVALSQFQRLVPSPVFLAGPSTRPLFVHGPVQLWIVDNVNVMVG